MEELLYRISAILKRVSHRKESNINEVLNIGKYLYNYPNRTLTINNSNNKLTSKLIGREEGRGIISFRSINKNMEIG